MTRLLLAIALVAGCTRKQAERRAPDATVEIKPWDGCADGDPNPWPWRSAAEGLWGEAPRLVPDFGYPQERRAPKMPDADRHLAALAAAHGQGFVDSLLICEVELYSHNGAVPSLYRYKLGDPPDRPRCGSDWDVFAPPDALLRFRFRDDYPIALFGPEDHWGFFISLPRVSLAVGDELAVKLWDRDSSNVQSSSNEFMGEARLRFDGELPLRIRTPFFTLLCNAMAPERALVEARPWLDGLDRGLATVAAWRPDENSWDFGAASRGVEIVTSDYGKQNFRYPAGFIGWDHPEIQERLARLRATVDEGDRLRRELAAALAGRAQAPAGSLRIDDELGTLRFLDPACDAKGCALRIEVGRKAKQELCRSSFSHLQWAEIDAGGRFTPLKLEQQGDAGWRACSDEAPSSERTVLRATPSDAATLLWLGGEGKAHLFQRPTR
jgi:hypothetical protein